MTLLSNSDILEKLNFNKIKFSCIKSLDGDASNRKYFLINQNNVINVLMYDDGLKDNIVKFSVATKVFNEYGISVPKIFFKNESQGLLILENFGTNKYSSILNKKNSKKLYKLAIDSLIHLHKFPASERFQNYSKKIYLDESMLFFEWYLKYKKINLDVRLINDFKEVMIKNLDFVDSFSKVNVHRDFHIDNLFFLSTRKTFRKCGWIDYQDALIGSPAYDLMSLLEDARRDIDNDLKKDLLNYYLEKTNNVNSEFFNISFQIIAIQRHLKVLGIFTRLLLRDKKPNYIKHLPRVLSMIKNNLANDEFKEIRKIISDLIKTNLA